MLQDPGYLLNSWWEEAQEWFLWWGAVWGCVSCVLTLLQVARKLKVVFCGTVQTNLDRQTLMKFVFLPGQELVNLFPQWPWRGASRRLGLTTSTQGEEEQQLMRVFPSSEGHGELWS